MPSVFLARAPYAAPIAAVALAATLFLALRDGTAEPIDAPAAAAEGGAPAPGAPRRSATGADSPSRYG